MVCANKKKWKKEFCKSSALPFIKNITFKALTWDRIIEYSLHLIRVFY